MAFPTTGILDAFTGSDEDPITTNWTTSMHSGHDQLRRVSNALQGHGAGSFSSGYYDITTYGPDSEAFITITTLPNENSQIRLLLRLQNIGVDTWDGYQLRYSHEAAADDFLAIYRMDDTADVLLGSVMQTFAAGDSIGFEMIGDTLKGYRKPAAGSWAELISQTDSTYDPGGYLGVMIAEGASPIVLDDFGGGTIQAQSGRRFHRFFGPTLLATSAATLYTVPTGCRAIIDHIRLVNNTASPVDVTMSIGANAASTRIWDSKTLAADESRSVKGPFTLESEEIFQAFAGTADAVTISAHGWLECL